MTAGSTSFPLKDVILILLLDKQRKVLYNHCINILGGIKTWQDLLTAKTKHKVRRFS